MKRRTAICAALLLLQLSIAASQPATLQSGPMVGVVEMTEATMWVQTTARASVDIVYWDVRRPDRRFVTGAVVTARENAFTARLVADSVRPGARYAYRLRIDGRDVARPYALEFTTPALWQWRNDPPSFTVAVGSCVYVNEPELDRPGAPYGGDYHIFTSIHRRRPEVMLWLGDNVYLREADWYSWSGIVHRYTHTRSLPEMQPLLASAANYALWDDHDYGPTDADRSYRRRMETRRAFNLFWAGSDGETDGQGIFSSFEWGDAEFFLLDNRWFRSPNGRRSGTREYLGEAQMRWLLDRLVSSRATFKIVAVGGQVLNPVAAFENYSTYAEERARLLELLDEEKIPGVIFLSGDRHHSELTMMPRTGAYPLYDLTVSPLTSRPYDEPTEANTLRVAGTYIGVRNFGLLQFSGAAKDRAVTMRILDADGREQWSRTIRADELR